MFFALTPGHIDDRVPVATMAKALEGWMFRGKGYLGKLFVEKLKKQSINLFTKVRKNMKRISMSPIQKQSSSF